MKTAKIFRKKKFVNWPVQGQLLMRMVLYYAAYNCALWFTAFAHWFFLYCETLVGDGTHTPLGQTFEEFAGQYRPMFYGVMIVFPIMLWDMVKTSHRFAGPLVQFQNRMKAHMAGEPLRPAALRDGDLLQEFQTCFNEFVTYVNANAAQANAADANATGDDSPADGGWQPQVDASQLQNILPETIEERETQGCSSR